MTASTRRIATTKKGDAIDRRFWGTPDKFTTFAFAGNSPTAGYALNGFYTFYIFDLATNELVEAPGLDPADRTDLAQYQFPVAPSSIEFGEPAATQIIPTQEGGMFVESHGSIFKDLRISGTVGFRPNPASNELIPGLGAATGVRLEVPGPLSSLLFNDERGLHYKEATGFDDMIFLRNIFRQYWDWKSIPELARRYVLVWVSAKESEAWVVEPINFTTNREASSPLSYKYQIQCRTLYPLDVKFVAFEDSLGGWLGVVKNIFNAFEVFNAAFKGIARAVNQLNDLVNYVAALPLNLLDDIISPALEVMSAVASMKNSFQFGIGQMYAQRVTQWVDNCRNAHQLLSASSAGGGFSNIADGGTGVTANPASDYTQSGAGQDGIDGLVRKHVRDMLRYSEQVLSLDFLWTPQEQSTVIDYANAYNNEYGEPPVTRGSPLNVSNIRLAESAEEKLTLNEDIRSAAKRLLGNEDRWKELVILNNLKSPYISVEGGDRVLQPGDPILVPVGASSGDEASEVPRAITEDEDSADLPPAYKRYGRDLMLSDSATSASLADLQVSPRGDLQLIEGPQNVEQAIKIKFSTEQGELATHPTFGAKYPIGEKFPGLQKFHEFSLNTRRTIRQDPRVKEIEKLQILIEGDQIRVNANLALRGADVELPVALSVRR